MTGQICQPILHQVVHIPPAEANDSRSRIMTEIDGGVTVLRLTLKRLDFVNFLVVQNSKEIVRPLRTRCGREIGGDEGIFVTVVEDDMVDVGSQVESTADGEAPIKVIRMIE